MKEEIAKHKNEEALRRAGFWQREGKFVYIEPNVFAVSVSDFLVNETSHDGFIHMLNNALKKVRVGYVPKDEGKTFAKKLP